MHLIRRLWIEEHPRQALMRLNEAAANIRSEADACALVDGLAVLLEQALPRPWRSKTVRCRVAQSEFESVSDPRRRISDRLIADVWNDYLRTIGASDDAMATASEIHYLRDALYASALYFWETGHNRSVYTAPNFCAVEPGGKVADGCRAIEALRILELLHRSGESLRGARAQVQKRALFSDSANFGQASTTTVTKELHYRVIIKDADPVRSAEAAYIQQHSQAGINQLRARVFDQLFPPHE